ncbi:non-canonical purine NTP pyrophosphatase [Litorimonas sp.]|uniref:non-canonical purine NTP pyrophosphatase n=1 Tax=Litorimonas sp. TaxID=1892381 RepID=UPI003A85D4D5|tara:strand:+ start:3205 stop:3849 length:645 start_codon:yes stop_codon:yes gene_type:complete
MRKTRVRYATKSSFKHDEVNQIISSAKLKNRHGAEVCAIDHFEVEFPGVSTNEPLERNLEEMVRHKAISAYQRILEPCIVEHAGLVLESHKEANYPGGLTQPMWDALGAEGFLSSVTWAGEKVTARAVVGYCDGMNVHIFVGETIGKFSPEPLGARKFYWDTVFIPDTGDGRTYAEISAGEGGLIEKVKLSQSRKAMIKCLEFMLRQDPIMFPA